MTCVSCGGDLGGRRGFCSACKTIQPSRVGDVQGLGNQVIEEGGGAYVDVRPLEYLFIFGVVLVVTVVVVVLIIVFG